MTPTQHKIIHSTRFGRDICLMLAGLALILHTPKSLQALQVDELAAVAWAATIVAGAAISLSGVLRSRPVSEVIGSVAVGVAYLVWATGAVLRPDASLLSLAFSLIMVSGAASQLYRAIIAASGVLELTEVEHP